MHYNIQSCDSRFDTMYALFTRSGRCRVLSRLEPPKTINLCLLIGPKNPTKGIKIVSTSDYIYLAATVALL